MNVLLLCWDQLTYLFRPRYLQMSCKMILNPFYVDNLQSVWCKCLMFIIRLIFFYHLCFSPGWVYIPCSCERGQQRPDKPLAQTQPHAPSPYPGCHGAPVGAGELLEETNHADCSQQLGPDPFFRPELVEQNTDVSVILPLLGMTWCFVVFRCCGVHMLQFTCICKYVIKPHCKVLTIDWNNKCCFNITCKDLNRTFNVFHFLCGNKFL